MNALYISNNCSTIGTVPFSYQDHSHLGITVRLNSWLAVHNYPDHSLLAMFLLGILATPF